MTLKLNGTNSVAAPAYAGDDADTGLQCGTNELKLVTGGTARATVDSDGRLLVGTDAAINTGNSPSLEIVDTGSAVLSLGRNDSTISADNVLGSVKFFGNDGGSYQQCAEIAATADGTHANDDKPTRLVFSTTADGASSPTERLRITSDGTIRLGSGSPGIDFSQIQTNASGMSSETLDSYEEGTWTAGLLARTAPSGSITFTQNTGTYIKIGKLCFISIFLAWSGSSLSGSHLQLTGLPFVQQTNNDRRGGFLITYRANALTGLSNVYDLTLRTETNQTNARFQYGNGDGNATTELTGASIKNASANMMITGTYEVA